MSGRSPSFYIALLFAATKLQRIKSVGYFILSRLFWGEFQLNVSDFLNTNYSLKYNILMKISL